MWRLARSRLVLVTCELTIFGLGSHSATGEEWADNSNAGTAAEAQAFKRSCACFGLGRYLIVSPERGWIWMTASGQSGGVQYHYARGVKHPK
jgi:hypothetical protein